MARTPAPFTRAEALAWLATPEGQAFARRLATPAADEPPPPSPAAVRAMLFLTDTEGGRPLLAGIMDGARPPAALQAGSLPPLTPDAEETLIRRWLLSERGLAFLNEIIDYATQPAILEAARQATRRLRRFHPCDGRMILTDLIAGRVRAGKIALAA